jgi:hypothetical protein
MAGAGAAFWIQAMLPRRRRELTQLLGAAGIMAVAPAAYYVTDEIHMAAWSLCLPPAARR